MINSEKREYNGCPLFIEEKNTLDLTTEGHSLEAILSRVIPDFPSEDATQPSEDPDEHLVNLKVTQV